MIQRRAESPSVPNSSPSTASPGLRRDDPVADQLLGRVIGLGDGREVRLGLDLQVVRAEAPQRDLVGEGRELEGEGEIGVDAATLARGAPGVSRPRRTGAACWTGPRRSSCRRFPFAVARPRRDRRARADRVRRRWLGQGAASRIASTTTTRRPPRRRPRSPAAGSSTTTSAARYGDDTPAVDRDLRQPDRRRSSRPSAFGVQGPQHPRRVSTRCSSCRIAASSPIWAAADIVPNPGVQLDPATVVLQRIGALWNVEATGTSGAGCQTAPANVRTELGLICP